MEHRIWNWIECSSNEYMNEFYTLYNIKGIEYFIFFHIKKWRITSVSSNWFKWMNELIKDGTWNPTENITIMSHESWAIGPATGIPFLLITIIITSNGVYRLRSDTYFGLVNFLAELIYWQHMFTDISQFYQFFFHFYYHEVCHLWPPVHAFVES